MWSDPTIRFSPLLEPRREEGVLHELPLIDPRAEAAEGRDLLAAWVFTLEKNREILEQFIARYWRLGTREVVG